MDNVDELRILLYDGTQMTVGATAGEAELDAIIAQGGRRGEIYSKLRAIRDQYADLIRARFPQIPRRVSGYNLDQLLPENGFHVARALVGTEGTCVIVLEAKLRLIHSPQHRTLVGLGYPRRVFGGGSCSGDSGVRARSGSKGSKAASSTACKKKGAPNLELLPEGRGFLLVEFGSNDPAEAERARARS